MDAPTNTNRLYALLIAIDDYPIPRHKLNGCVNDRNAFKDFLERKYGALGMELHIKTLTDQEATKPAIIESFQHFQGAQDGDTCVYYFSGHGSQSPSPEAFWHLDPDHMNQSMVCWDSRIKGGKDLMDKELSFLFWEASHNKNVHFLTVFDCCHSGTITRDFGITTRMAEAAPTPATLEDYHGYQHYKQHVENGVTMLTPPRGNIIQLSASKSYETAKELRINGQPRGIFTYSLIEALEQGGGQLSYADIVQMLRIRIGNKVRQQTPQLHAQPHERRWRFLNTSLPVEKPYFLANFEKDQWVVNAGSIHGIGGVGSELELGNGKKVTLAKVEATKSILSGTNELDPKQTYQVYANEMAFQKMKAAFAPEGEEAGIEILTKAVEKFKPSFLEMVEHIEDADYWIRAEDGTLQLTLPNDPRPVFRRVEGYGEYEAIGFMDNMELVAKWRNLLEVRNPSSTIQDHEFDFELYQITEAGNYDDDAPLALMDWKEEAVYRYTNENEEWHQPAFQLKIKNTGFRKLYFSAINMLDNFGITNRFMNLQELDPGQEAWLLDVVDNVPYKTIPLEVDDAYHSWGITEAAEYFKIFISNDPNLDTDLYNQEGLELDVKPTSLTRAGRKGKSSHRKLDWTTREIKLRVVRPMDEVPLAAGEAAPLFENMTIQTPVGLQAKAKLATLPDTQRALDESNAALQSLNQHSAGMQATVEPFELSRSNGESAGLSVLELKDVDGANAVSPDSPLVINTARSLDEGTSIMPLGYDPETGMIYPLGFGDEDGTITIESLPEGSPNAERSLGGSIKIFFQKMVLSQLGAYNYPQIAIPEFEEEGENFIYNTDIESVKTAVANAQNIVMVIHGIIGDTKEMAKSLRRATTTDGHWLEKKFDLILTFDYENLNTPIEETARLMGQKLAEAGLPADHGKSLTIMAHSMGGLVSRWFIEKEGGNSVVSHLIQLGTPNAGSPWSSVYELASTLLARVINGASFLQPYLVSLSFLGRYAKKLFVTLEQMHAEKSEFLQNLNDGTDPGIPYTIIAGNTRLILSPQEEKQQALLRKLLGRIKNRGQYDALDLFLFKTTNDIAVSVESILGIADKENRQLPPTTVEVPCDHLAYFGTKESLDEMVKAVEGSVLDA